MRPRKLIFDNFCGFGGVKRKWCPEHLDTFLALLLHNTRLHSQHIWEQIKTNKLTKVFILILELHIYDLVGVVASLLVFFIEFNTAFPPPSPVFVRNVALIFSNVWELVVSAFNSASRVKTLPLSHILQCSRTNWQ